PTWNSPWGIVVDVEISNWTGDNSSGASIEYLYAVKHRGVALHGSRRRDHQRGFQADVGFCESRERHPADPRRGNRQRSSFVGDHFMVSRVVARELLRQQSQMARAGGKSRQRTITGYAYLPKHEVGGRVDAPLVEHE